MTEKQTTGCECGCGSPAACGRWRAMLKRIRDTQAGLSDAEFEALAAEAEAGGEELTRATINRYKERRDGALRQRNGDDRPQFTVRLAPDLVGTVRAASAHSGRSLDTVFSAAVRRWLEENSDG